MQIAAKPFLSLLSAITLTVLGCHAQVPSPALSATLSPDTARRVEVLIRAKFSVPPSYSIAVGSRFKSDIPGFDTIPVTFTTDSKSSKPTFLLLSTDGKTLAQLITYDIAKDPRTVVSADGRPARGGPSDAPVLIVGFDDLECPFCARMHQQLFPALLDRYGDRVHIVYRDYPLSQHPWALRAAIDSNCVGAQSTPGYWNMVDTIHAHAGDFGGTEKSLAKANDALDALAEDEGKRQKLNSDTLKACIARQDDSGVKASMKEADALGVEATPALFINGERIDGAVPLADIYRAIDGALVAAGQTPPPPPRPHRRPSAGRQIRQLARSAGDPPPCSLSSHPSLVPRAPSASLCFR